MIATEVITKDPVQTPTGHENIDRKDLIGKGAVIAAAVITPQGDIIHLLDRHRMVE